MAEERFKTTLMGGFDKDDVLNQVREIDVYKRQDVNKLRKYVSERGKILPRRITGNCAKHQRALTVAVKRARHLAMMPYIQD